MEPLPQWPDKRASVHASQLTRAEGAVGVQVSPEVLTQLADAAAEGYTAAFPDAELVTFTVAGVRFLFDHSTNPARSPRTVAAWSHTRTPVASRDRSRQAGFPLPGALADAGYERGHLIAHASGGGLDANVFAQAWHVNQGRSPQGRRYRLLERLAAANPGCQVLHRLIYGDGSDVPDLTELTVVVDGRAQHGVFDNRPGARTSPTGPLRRGSRFHRQVQAAFLIGLAGASAYPEHAVRLVHGGRGRVDLHVVPDLGERYAVVVEIKSTDWDALPEHRVRPNLRIHIRQLQRYLDRYIADLDATMDGDDTWVGGSGGRWDSVSGILLYPRRPTNTTRLQLIDDRTHREAIMVAWYDDADWATPATPAP